MDKELNIIEEQLPKEKSIAWKIIKGLFITNVVTLCLWFCTIIGFIWYIQLFDYANEETNISQDNNSSGHNSSIINKGGEINGETDNKNNRTKEN